MKNCTTSIVRTKRLVIAAVPILASPLLTSISIAPALAGDSKANMAKKRAILSGDRARPLEIDDGN